MAVAAFWLSSAGDGAFGGPKLARSDDLRVWTTAGPDKDRTKRGFAGRHVNLAFTRDDKLVTAFHYDTDSEFSSLRPGIAVWREP